MSLYDRPCIHIHNTEYYNNNLYSIEWRNISLSQLQIFRDHYLKYISVDYIICTTAFQILRGSRKLFFLKLCMFFYGNTFQGYKFTSKVHVRSNLIYGFELKHTFFRDIVLFENIMKKCEKKNCNYMINIFEAFWLCFNSSELRAQI